MVDRAGLENRNTFTGIEGSNPSLSASGAQAQSRWMNMRDALSCCASLCWLKHDVDDFAARFAREITQALTRLALI